MRVGDRVSGHHGIREAPLRTRRRRIRRTLVAAVTAALMLVVVIALHARWQAARQLSALERFARASAEIESEVRLELISPTHDVQPGLERARGRIEELERQLSTHRDLAAGPGHYALGRAWMALGEPETARQHLDHAWALGHTTPETAYALGWSLGQLYRRALARSGAIRDSETRELALADAGRKLRQPAVEYLQRSRGN